MATRYTRRVLVVVTAADRTGANAEAALGSGKPADAETWTVGLSPTGAEPATHYWASMALTEAEYEEAQLAFARRGERGRLAAYDLARDGGRPAAVLASLGLQPVAAAQPQDRRR